MARLPPPRTLLPFSLAVCLLLLLCLLAVSGQQAAPLLPPVPDPKASAKELEEQGDALRAQKRYLDALDFYKAAMAKQPSALLWNKEGMSYILLRRNVDATKCFNNAIKLDKHAPEGYNNRGYMEYTKQNYGKAIHDYKKALSLRPTRSEEHTSELQSRGHLVCRLLL